VIEVVRDNAENYSRLRPLVEDMKSSLQEFSQWRIDFVKRDNNFAAHPLAKLAIQNVVEKTWKGELPDCIRDIVLLQCFSPVV
jgi:hypothetical protein